MVICPRNPLRPSRHASPCRARRPLTPFVVHRDLRLGTREARANEKESNPGFLRRLRARIHQIDRLRGRADASTPRYRSRQHLNVSRLQVCRSCEGIECRDSAIDVVPPSDVHAVRAGFVTAIPSDRPGLRRLDPVRPRPDASAAGGGLGYRSSAGADALDPFRTMHRGRRLSSHYTRTPQTTATPPWPAIVADSSPPRHVDIAVYGDESASQRVRRQPVPQRPPPYR